MKSRAAILLLAMGPLWAQQPAKLVAVTTPGNPGAMPCVNGPRILPQSFTSLEGRFNSTLTALNDKDPIDLVGDTRALYLKDYGLTMTAEIMLVRTPSIGPFRKEIPAAEKARVHQRKLDQLPALKKSMREMIKASALVLAGAVGLQGMEGSGLQVVLAVKVLYQVDWEDLSGLPAQIVMKADLKGALNGDIQEEVQ
ncbi:MAG TPA: hypothetical protein VGH38_01995 [Bryobacteraceae bacterium]|jgi:hypothetical protein